MLHGAFCLWLRCATVPGEGEAARIGGMDRQTLRDWVHRFNAAGPDGLHDQWRNGSVCRLTADQLAELSALVTTGPDRARDGVVRWRRVDLQRVIEERFGVSYHERHVSALLKRLGSATSARVRVTPVRIRPS